MMVSPWKQKPVWLREGDCGQMGLSEIWIFPPEGSFRRDSEGWGGSLWPRQGTLGLGPSLDTDLL